MLAGCPLNWALAFAFITSGSSLHAQSEYDLSLILDQDGKDYDLEEDISLLQDLSLDKLASESRLLRRLEALSFLSQQDIKHLNKIENFSMVRRAVKKDEISDRLRVVLNIILRRDHSTRKQQLRINQYQSFNRDTRYKYKIQYGHSNLDAGMLLERDAGETDIFDHMSFFVTHEKNNFGLFLGDYQVASGYGLLSWSAFPLRKGFESVTSLSRMGRGIRRFISTHESWGYRGIGIRWINSLGTWQAALNSRHQDGHIDSTGLAIINVSGLHTSARSLSEKNKLIEQSAVVQWRFEKENATISATHTVQRWLYYKSSTELEQGSSIAANFSGGNKSIFGEVAIGFNSKTGTIIGVEWKTKGLHYVFAARKYSPGFRALRMNPVARFHGKTLNEAGIFQGFRIRHNQNRLIIYGDMFTRKLPAHTNNKVSSGNEFGLRWEWRKKDRYYKIEWKQGLSWLEIDANYLGEYGIGLTQSRQFRLIGKMPVFNGQSMKVQGIWQHRDNNEYGTGINLRYNWKKDFLTVALDWVTTKINSSNVRIYFWDVNLPGELITKLYAHSGHSIALKAIYSNRGQFSAGLRTRILWRDLEFDGKPIITGALYTEVAF